MPKINKLAEEVIQKIAAGEVIERPASVLKELLENSLDAGSTQIIVEIEKAGKSKICVTDNGTGMEDEDVKNSIARYATSKIKDISDLENIHTFGFRGEALSSIAAVAHLKIITKTKHCEMASVLYTEGNKHINLDKTAAQAGTTIEVKKLFFNLPARLKFLKSDATETAHILNITTSLAIAEPDISFKLISNKKELINCPVNQTLLERIRQLLGKEVSENLIEINCKQDDFCISGYISRPDFASADRSSQFFLVNKRPVVSRSVNHAIYSAYQKFMARDKFPAVFININIAPRLVDVNVHPTKKEVRFVSEKEIHDAIYQELLTKLTQIAPKAFTQFSRENNYAGANVFQDAGGVPVNTAYTQEYFKDFAEDITLKPQAGATGAKQPYMRQLKRMYILTEGEDALVIYDQHAAHERILYERFFKKKDFLQAEKQILLIPLELELSPAQNETLRQNIDIFKQIGIDIEQISGCTFVAGSCPAFIEQGSIKEIISGVISDLEYSDLPNDINLQYEKICALLACHAAIKAGQDLSQEEMLELVAELKNTDNPLYCPHGRPTSVKITYEQLLKNFGRGK